MKVTFKQLKKVIREEFKATSDVGPKIWITLSELKNEVHKSLKNMNETCDESECSEDDECSCDESEKKMREAQGKKAKNNPWAICTSQVGRDDKAKYERCVMGVKKGMKK